MKTVLFKVNWALDRCELQSVNSCPNQWIVFCKNNRILQESQKTDSALFWADMQDSFFHIQNLYDYFCTFKYKEGPTR